MNLRLVAVVVLALTCQVAFAASSKKVFEVTVEDVKGGGRILSLTFFGKPPSPTVVDKILRESLDHAILVDPAVDIVANAFHGDDMLNSNQYSGTLIYKTSEKKVMTLDEYRGVKTTTTSTDAYFVEVQEDKTFEGIKPERKWLSVTLVFPKQPARDAAYAAIIAEARKLTPRGLDVNLYVSVGDQKVKTSWKQMRDEDGAYVFAEYSAESKKLVRKEQVLKQLP